MSSTGRSYFSENLRKLRIQRNLMRSMLAEKVGISDCYYSDIENGKKMPSLEVFVRFCKILKVPAAVLLKNKLIEDTLYDEEVFKKLMNYSDEQLSVILNVLSSMLS